ncbi:MAG TPA: hypothetical protein VN690_07555 [Terriglobales bacterium]|nr:hypothetical protein [Terriglobales bacterium]
MRLQLLPLQSVASTSAVHSVTAPSSKQLKKVHSIALLHSSDVAEQVTSISGRSGLNLANRDGLFLAVVVRLLGGDPYSWLSKYNANTCGAGRASEQETNGIPELHNSSSAGK